MRPDKSGDWHEAESRGENWIFCADCGSQYRNEDAAKLCCDRMLQAFVMARRAAVEERERARFRGGYSGP